MEIAQDCPLTAAATIAKKTAQTVVTAIGQRIENPWGLQVIGSSRIVDGGIERILNSTHPLEKHYEVVLDTRFHFSFPPC